MIVVTLIVLLAGYYAISLCRRPGLLAAHRGFMKALNERDMISAYKFMSDDYKATHDWAAFVSQAPEWADAPLFEWEASVGITPWASVYQTNEDGWRMGLSYEYVREDGDWRFAGETEFFQD